MFFMFPPLPQIRHYGQMQGTKLPLLRKCLKWKIIRFRKPHFKSQRLYTVMLSLVFTEKTSPWCSTKKRAASVLWNTMILNISHAHQRSASGERWRTMTPVLPSRTILHSGMPQANLQSIKPFHGWNRKMLWKSHSHIRLPVFRLLSLL